jgi:hypothetical protein
MQRFGGGKLMERDYLEELDVCGRIIVKGIFQELDVRQELD